MLKFSDFSVLVIFICSSCCLSPANSVSNSIDLQPEYLRVPISSYVNSLIETKSSVRRATSIVSGFVNIFEDSRFNNAISDCFELLEFSSDDTLSLAISSLKYPNRVNNGIGDPSSDLRTWLSAVLTNVDTCIDGLEGADSFVKDRVASRLSHTASLVHGLLATVHPTQSPQPAKTARDGGKHDGGFPSWVKRKDQRLLMTDDVSWADIVVAKDGSGNVTTITEAVLQAPNNSMRRYVIYIKKGVYRENVEIKKKKWNLMMIGDGMDATIISGNRSVAEGWTTFRSATFGVQGFKFIARDITFENTVGPEKSQAVALRSDSDLSVFYRCRIRGYQDTLYAHSMRQFYRECNISGTVDFIFGNGAVVFQKCQILVKKGSPNQKMHTITAQGRISTNQSTGFSLQFCNISADFDLLQSMNSTATYLGRPWRPYSRTIIMQSYLSDVVKPEGWLDWNNRTTTLYYGEFMNYGPGSGLGNRVNWPGYHVLNDSSQADNFTVSRFIRGDLWLPSTGIEYNRGLEPRGKNLI